MERFLYKFSVYSICKIYISTFECMLTRALLTSESFPAKGKGMFRRTNEEIACTDKMSYFPELGNALCI